jgi:hypothetical protein
MANETIQEQRERDYQLHLAVAERIAPTWELDPQVGDTLLELAAGVGDTGFEAASAVTSHPLLRRRPRGRSTWRARSGSRASCAKRDSPRCGSRRPMGSSRSPTPTTIWA